MISNVTVTLFCFRIQSPWFKPRSTRATRERSPSKHTPRLVSVASFNHPPPPPPPQTPGPPPHTHTQLGDPPPHKNSSTPRVHAPLSSQIFTNVHTVLFCPNKNLSYVNLLCVLKPMFSRLSRSHSVQENPNVPIVLRGPEMCECSQLCSLNTCYTVNVTKVL